MSVSGTIASGSASHRSRVDASHRIPDCFNPPNNRTRDAARLASINAPQPRTLLIHIERMAAAATPREHLLAAIFRRAERPAEPLRRPASPTQPYSKVASTTARCCERTTTSTSRIPRARAASRPALSSAQPTPRSPEHGCGNAVDIAVWIAHSPHLLHRLVNMPVRTYRDRPQNRRT